MKKTKIIIPALGILLLSTAASVTGTVAWFSMNSEVTANGMQVKAKAENGIVIANAAGGTYSDAATTVKTGVKELVPGSTANLVNWYHNNSSDPATATGASKVGEYETGYAWSQARQDAESPCHYIVHDFFIRSSAATAIEFNSLDVKAVVINNGTDPVDPLSRSLRVGTLIDGGSPHIFAPVTGYDDDYTVAGATGAYNVGNRVTPTIAVAGADSAKDTAITSVPANTADGTHVGIYVWFEGEDSSCISNNITATLETLTVVVTFGYSE